MIQKNIIQTSKDFSSLPFAIKENICNLMQRNKEWKYLFFDDADMIREVKEAGFDTSLINPKFSVILADIFRYVAVRKYGGFYLDIKSTAFYPFDNILGNREYLLMKWPSWPKVVINGIPSEVGSYKELLDAGLNGEIVNWGFAFSKGHEALDVVINNVKDNIKNYSPSIFGIGKPAVLRISGPVAFTLACNSVGLYKQAIYCDHVGVKYTILKDTKTHRKMYDLHYSAVKEPPINQRSS